MSKVRSKEGGLDCCTIPDCRDSIGHFKPIAFFITCIQYNTENGQAWTSSPVTSHLESVLILNLASAIPGLQNQSLLDSVARFPVRLGGRTVGSPCLACPLLCV
jgi:hypothetical protein